MPAQKDSEGQQALLVRHRRRLAILLEQQARFGVAYTPPATVADIQEACADIRRIKTTLRNWSATVEDLPDDDADRRTLIHPAPSEQKGILLLRSREAVRHDLQDQIMRGAILRDHIRTSPPPSQAALDAESSAWHRWRQISIQTFRESFSAPEPLQWLDALSVRHLDFAQSWETRANALLPDIEQELAYLNNLSMRLNNYPERDG
jgi:hypothetical protein